VSAFPQTKSIRVPAGQQRDMYITASWFQVLAMTETCNVGFDDSTPEAFIQTSRMELPAGQYFKKVSFVNVAEADSDILFQHGLDGKQVSL
jgi:hypothetical protein